MDNTLVIQTVNREITIVAHQVVIDYLELVAHQIDISNNGVIVYFDLDSDKTDGTTEMTLGCLIDIIARKEFVNNDYSIIIKTIN